MLHSICTITHHQGYPYLLYNLPKSTLQCVVASLGEETTRCTWTSALSAGPLPVDLSIFQIWDRFIIPFVSHRYACRSVVATVTTTAIHWHIWGLRFSATPLLLFPRRHSPSQRVILGGPILISSYTLHSFILTHDYLRFVIGPHLLIIYLTFHPSVDMENWELLLLF